MLIATARAAAHEAWAVRRVAALLLQRQFLLLRASDIAEHDRLFVCLGIKVRAGLQVPSGNPFSTTDSAPAVCRISFENGGGI